MACAVQAAAPLGQVGAPSLESSYPLSPLLFFPLVILSVTNGRVLESPAVTASSLLLSVLPGFASQILRLVVSSVAQLCSALFNPMDCSTPAFPVHHQLSELAQTYVHWVGDAI